MMRGVDGFYTYAKFERFQGWPSMSIDQTRVAFKLNQQMFSYMAVSDTRQGIMPTEEDRIRGISLDYKEAVLLTDPSNPFFKDKVDDKYQFSSDIKDNRVHGWVSSNPAVGFWVITPSNEYKMGGPLKQELSSHVGPTSLEVFFSSHYAGEVSMMFADGEPWEKVFGPTFIYLNSVSHDIKNPGWTLWEDAKNRLMEESNNWPYNFARLESGFPGSKERGVVWGRLLVRDWYMSQGIMNGSYAYVGLAAPGEPTSWQTENKGYQFWTEADSNGQFSIKNVRPGNYNLFAWVPGVIGDYRYEIQVNVTQGGMIGLGDIVYWPVRAGPTLWEIGVPDRTAAEFYVPDPRPERINPVFGQQKDNFRHYGLWERYSDLYPEKDLVYTVGTSNYSKDWFYAHVTRRKADNSHVPTTWTILFDLVNVNKNGTYYFRIALAASSLARLEIRINDPKLTQADYLTRMIGRDNAIARHGIHGLYRMLSFKIPGWKLWSGRNAFYLTQSIGNNPFSGFMYDYLRLEGPA
ncbi:rhamnogalacturonate lyase B-like [Impatiens glandulifera]|uniref:rhamnogalacturonate lyase B-like n=1 Tax=Impatiens glandulifera TaxID=253017 RepID=UPI001FB167B4|nr:rhamnogalacturonate lyase B-like [Impatiens glandulifera]